MNFRGSGTRRSAALRRFAVGLGIAGPLLSVPAAAEEAPAPPPATPDIETIVVTAEKRAEKLQEVPVSIAVVSEETLKAFDMTKTTDLPYLVPSLTLLDAAGPRDSGFFIRGIGTTTFAPESIEGSTAFILDGVVLGQSGASLTDLPDVKQVEVLRGPQGTLFGSNASAGVVSVTTRAPSDKFEEDLGVTWADPQNERKFTGIVTGPITDDLKFLVSARWNQTDGYITNVFDGRKFNNGNDGGARGKLEYTPSDRLDVTLIADYFKSDAQCCIWTLRSVGAVPSPTEAIDIAAGIVPSPNNRQTNVDGPVFSRQQSFGGSMQADYHFGDDYVLTSITAFRRWLTRDGLDSDSASINVLDVNFGDLEQHQISQELRVASPVGGFVDYVAGLYYFDQGVASESKQLFPTVPAPFFNDVVDNRGSTRNAALFGQANLHLTDKFRVILGARGLNERISASKDRADPVFLVTSEAAAGKSSDAFVWRGGLQYDLTSRITAFATATRGYKGGGFDTDISFGSLPYVRPEVPTDFEIGLRSAWPAERLVVNVTGFDDRIRNYQASGFNSLVDAFTIQNANATTRGIEFDGTWRPLAESGWSLIGSGSYVDARWASFANAGCYNGQTVAQGCVGGVENLTGQVLPFSPTWHVNLDSHYETEVPGERWTVAFDLGIDYRTKTEIGIPNDPNLFQGGYALLNGSVTLASDPSQWRVSLFGRNLTDQHYEIVAFQTPFGSSPGGYSGFIPYEAQRIVGLSLDLTF